ncbi:MAG: K(+)-transporting ATPase subunit F [candidate division Zixibacteria bacterium]|nr:K(+)-transporting ATPase subunit F [candidate division Zixibacteria bacterium]
MDVEFVLAGIAAFGLLVYLAYALLHPEKFQ